MIQITPQTHPQIFAVKLLTLQPALTNSKTIDNFG